MVYTEFDTGLDTIFIVLFSMTIVGLPILVFFSFVDDKLAHRYAAENSDHIVGRCETCGDLTRSEHAHIVFEPELGREVLLCPWGHNHLGHNAFATDSEEREKALKAIKAPMWLKRLR